MGSPVRSLPSRTVVVRRYYKIQKTSAGVGKKIKNERIFRRTLYVQGLTICYQGSGCHGAERNASGRWIIRCSLSPSGTDRSKKVATSTTYSSSNALGKGHYSRKVRLPYNREIYGYICTYADGLLYSATTSAFSWTRFFAID